MRILNIFKIFVKKNNFGNFFPLPKTININCFFNYFLNTFHKIKNILTIYGLKILVNSGKEKYRDKQY